MEQDRGRLASDNPLSDAERDSLLRGHPRDLAARYDAPSDIDAPPENADHKRVLELKTQEPQGATCGYARFNRRTAEDWYSEPELARLREAMLRAYQAWKQVARGQANDDTVYRHQREMMEAARRAVDTYMVQRDVSRRGRAVPTKS